MHLVILGCGRSGSALALSLASEGHQVSMIEKNPDVLRRLGERQGIRVVLGNGLDTDTLEKAGIAQCDAFFALTRGDNTNLMAAQIVQRTYRVNRVAVKVADPLRADAYRALGLFCINASSLLAGICRDWLMGNDFRPADQYNSLLKELEI
jgi:trk system potassium uptake protein TrkA